MLWKIKIEWLVTYIKQDGVPTTHCFPCKDFAYNYLHDHCVSPEGIMNGVHTCFLTEQHHYELEISRPVPSP